MATAEEEAAAKDTPLFSALKLYVDSFEIS
jgi:hypothetical protein